MSESTETGRAIGRRQIAAGEARTARIEPERLNRWFLPVTGDLRVGGTFHSNDIILGIMALDLLANF